MSRRMRYDDLAAQLIYYGAHAPDCNCAAFDLQPPSCTCGLTEVFRELKLVPTRRVQRRVQPFDGLADDPWVTRARAWREWAA